jgi:iron(III) transport system substrate-binding protein
VSGADRQEKLVAGARLEGGLSLYSSLTNDDMAALLPVFDAKYGLKTRFWRGDSEGILQRAVTEAHGGRADFDAIETSGATMEALVREDLLAPLASPVFADVSPKARHPGDLWVSTRFQVQSNAYNTNAVKAADAPKDWSDLAAPKWKGKLGTETENAIWLGALAGAMGEEKALALFRAIAVNGVTLRKGHTLLANLVASGETPVGVGLYRYRAEQLRREGAPVATLDFTPLVVHSVGVGVAKAAPHPNSAALFVDFLLTDGARILKDRDTWPTNLKVAAEPPNAVYIDHAKALDEQDKWNRLFKDIFGARRG